MNSAAETFVVALARASKQARRFLRGLSHADRDDVLAEALCWCWENRTTYNPAVPLDTWFVGAIRDARKSLHRDQLRYGASGLSQAIVSPDDIESTAVRDDVVARWFGNLNEVEAKIVTQLARGDTRSQIRYQTAIGNDALAALKRRLREFELMVPENDRARVLWQQRRSSTPYIGIDRELEKLDFPPPSGVDCPPCWRCRWFDGFLPGAYKPLRMPIQEAEVRDAVRDTEARKIDIAERVCAGTVNKR